MSKSPIEFACKQLTTYDISRLEEFVRDDFLKQFDKNEKTVPMVEISFEHPGTGYGKLCDNSFLASPTGINGKFELIPALVKWCKDLCAKQDAIEKNMKNFSGLINEEIKLLRLNAMWINSLLNRLQDSGQIRGRDRQLFIHLYDGGFPHPDEKLVFFD